MSGEARADGGRLEVRLARLDDAGDAAAVCALTQAYACDAMGNAGPLDEAVLVRLVPGLRAHGGARVFLAFDGDAAVGLATCFVGFSTFQARPLLNVHDLAVLPAWRGRGVGRALLAAVETDARALGCGKLTLEVVEANAPARALYAKVGFEAATYGEAASAASFLAKRLV